MFNDYEAIIDETEENETSDEYDGAVQESDYPAPQGTFPVEHWEQRVKQAETEGPKIREELKTLDEKLREATKERVETELLVKTWNDKLKEWRIILSKRLIPNSEDLATIRQLEESAAKAEIKWEQVKTQIDEIERRKKVLLPDLARVHAIEALTDSQVLSVNLSDALLPYPDVIAECASALCNVFRRKIITIMDYQMNRLNEQIARIQAGRLEGSAIDSMEDERIQLLQEEVARFEEKIRVCENSDNIYAMIYKYYKGESTAEQQQYIYPPFSKARIRADRLKKSAEKAEQRAAERAATQAEKVKFDSVTEPSF